LHSDQGIANAVRLHIDIKTLCINSSLVKLLVKT